ncbi:MAG: hypothetical protein K2Y22_06580 [Candidatus Obscuribacterales bacterium]|nr:hypothetical protein [Candidatus Obscuribacterales bacterium]
MKENTNYSFDLARRIALSCVAAMFIILGVTFGSPYSPLTLSWISLFRPLFSCVGLCNNFGVFAPDPAQYNQQFRAIVTFGDGTTTTWHFPSLVDYKNSDVMKQLKLPWVEWEYYLVWDQQNAVLLPDAAKYIAYIHRNPKNQPVQVEIFRDYQYISVPGKIDKRAGVAKSDSVLKYAVQEEDLK